MNSRDEVVLTLTDDIDTDESETGGNFRQPTRRIALTGHFFFRIMALIIYLFCAWFTSSFVLPFVFVLISLSLDFWFVKNISGRILVGLRWSSYTDDTGNICWRFDSRPAPAESGDGMTLSRREQAVRAAKANAAKLFWVGLVGAPCIWGVFVLAAIFSLQFRWAVVAATGLFMSAINLYGFLRCRLASANESTSNFLSGLQSKVSRNVFNEFWSSVTRGMKPTSQSQQPPPGPVTLEA